MNSVKNGSEDNNPKIPKGYRLKLKTHKKIKELQRITGGSQEIVISRAIRLYSRKLNK